VSANLAAQVTVKGGMELHREYVQE